MNFNIPCYSNIHKFILVDELALIDNPALIHYGKCSVIGYLSSCDQLSSITISNIKKFVLLPRSLITLWFNNIFCFRCYQIPDCSLSVKLVMDFNPSKFLNTTVEVCGDVRLYDSTSKDCSLESSHSLITKLGNLQTSLEEARGLPARPPSGTNDLSLHYAVKGRLQKEIDEYRMKYKPIIQVSTIRHISEAREIIFENLHFREIQNIRRNLLKNQKSF